MTPDHPPPPGSPRAWIWPLGLGLLVVWIVVVARPAARLLSATARDILTRALSDADRHAVHALLSRLFGQSDALGSVVFSVALFLVVLGVPFLVRAWRPALTLPSLAAVCLALAVGFAAGASVLADLGWLVVIVAAALELGYHVLVRTVGLPDDRLEAYVLRAAVGRLPQAA